jgi:hypothetical protein
VLRSTWYREAMRSCRCRQRQDLIVHAERKPTERLPCMTLTTMKLCVVGGSVGTERESRKVFRPLRTLTEYSSTWYPTYTVVESHEVGLSMIDDSERAVAVAVPRLICMCVEQEACMCPLKRGLLPPSTEVQSTIGPTGIY